MDASGQPSDARGANAETVLPASFWQDIPEAAYRFEMVAVPGDEASGAAPFWISKCEITWETFDAFVYPPSGGADAAAVGADAITRPSKPYLPPDRGFGHEGYAAICLSHKNAEAFCEWLSAVSGRTYRLPTEAEWERACMAGGEDVIDAAALHELAWFQANAGGTPHPVGTKQPNAWGLHDMRGNVAEWVNGRDGSPVVKGGSYRDDAAMLAATARQAPTSAWNATDPQIPKSQWWLSDAPFVGFRVVCEEKRRNAEKPKSRKAETRKLGSEEL